METHLPCCSEPLLHHRHTSDNVAWNTCLPPVSTSAAAVLRHRSKPPKADSVPPGRRSSANTARRQLAASRSLKTNWLESVFKHSNFWEIHLILKALNSSLGCLPAKLLLGRRELTFYLDGGESKFWSRRRRRSCLALNKTSHIIQRKGCCACQAQRGQRAWPRGKIAEILI